MALYGRLFSLVRPSQFYVQIFGVPTWTYNRDFTALKDRFTLSKRMSLRHVSLLVSLLFERDVMSTWTGFFFLEGKVQHRSARNRALCQHGADRQCSDASNLQCTPELSKRGGRGSSPREKAIRVMIRWCWSISFLKHPRSVGSVTKVSYDNLKKRWEKNNYGASRGHYVP